MTAPAAPSPGRLEIPKPAQAYWTMRFVLARNEERIRALLRCAEIEPPGADAAGGNARSASSVAPVVGTEVRRDAGGLAARSGPHLSQWMAFACDFMPQRILVLGENPRAACAFVEAAHLLGAGQCRVLYLETGAGDWEKTRAAPLRAAMPGGWSAPLRVERWSPGLDCESALRSISAEADGTPVVREAGTPAVQGRTLLYWDGQNREAGECLFGVLLPLLASSEHAVIVDGISDARFSGRGQAYGERQLWNPDSHGQGRPPHHDQAPIRIGDFESASDALVALTDFTSRNAVPLHSTAHSLHTELGGDELKRAEMRALLGDLFSLQAEWCWFTLNDAPSLEALTFPRLVSPALPPPRPVENAENLKRPELGWRFPLGNKFVGGR